MNFKRSTLFVSALALASLCGANVAFAASDSGQNAAFYPENQNIQPAPQDDYNAYPPKTDKISNVYLGATVGLVNTHLENKSTTLGQVAESSLGSMGVNGGLVFGVCNSFDKFYLSVEAQGIVSSWKNDLTFGADQYTFKTPYSASLDVRPGYVFAGQNTILYGVLGLGLKQIKAEVSDVNLFRLNDFSKMAVGVRIGIGVENYLTKNVSLRGQYVYNAYSSVNTTYEAYGITTKDEYKPSSSQFSVILSYHF